MNEKQKAEAYVRSKLPELMELSFGCHVYTGRFSAEQVVLDNDGKELMVRSTVNGLIQDYKFKEMHNLEIIGHPIELQHYLQILDKIADKQKVIYRLINCRVLYFGKVIVKFHQKTGQPEDEEDWKAFNQILGI